MLQKERIILMTKLAAFEQRENKKVFRINSYLKKDYVTVNVIMTLFTTSIVYILGCVLFIVARYKELLENVQNVNLLRMAYLIVGCWIAFEIAFCLFSAVYYRRKHRKVREKIEAYVSDLRKLEQLYAAEAQE